MLSRRDFVTAAASAAATVTPAARAMLGPATPTFRPLSLADIHPAGDLLARTLQNKARLEEPLYRPPLVFAGVNAQSWPGDIEGRALLAITLLARATHDAPPYLRPMFADYRTRLAPTGIFGPPLSLTAINEQQLSGHGWLLRGLCEYYEHTHDPAALAMVDRIITTLALPLRGAYALYPIDPALRTHTGGDVDGSVVGQQGRWVLSSDIGCAFIFLDGLAHAWVLTRNPALKSLIDEAIARFLQVDLVAMGAQTHATLTAMRALLRVYAVTAAPALLSAVRERYTLYKTLAMTEHYANYNWFGRPETWTEPCAIIDSFMIAHQLWLHTADPAYLEDAQLIWYNGVGRGMRGNGGFGTDLCAGYKTPFLKVRSYEAYFCCTMRAGEGHARAIEYLYHTAPNTLTLLTPSDSTATLNLGAGSSFTLQQSTGYPYTGGLHLKVLASTCRRPITLRIFAPRWTTAHTLTLNGTPTPATLAAGFLTLRFLPRPGDTLNLAFDLRITPRDPLNARSIKGYYAFEAGPILLGHEPEPATPETPSQSPTEVFIPRDATLTPIAPGRYRVSGTSITLSRINDINLLHLPPKSPITRQILFRPA